MIEKHILEHTIITEPVRQGCCVDIVILTIIEEELLTGSAWDYNKSFQHYQKVLIWMGQRPS